MKTTRTLTTVALAIAIALPATSQAQLWPWRRNGQVQQNQQTAQQMADSTPASASTSAQAEAHERHHKTFLGALKGGGLGCLAGIGIGLLRHQSALKDCVVGAAAGAVIGGVVAYRKQVDEAKQVAAAAKAAGGTADYTTKTVDAKTADGSTQQTQALDTLTIHLDPNGVAERDPKTSAVLTQTADMAKTSSRPVVITVNGTDEQQQWIADQIRATDPNAQINEVYASKPSLVLVAG